MFKKLFWLAIYAIAMAYVESAVVVYLRELYYPEGFTFPVVKTPLNISLIEIGREAATVIMLFSVAAIAFKKPLIRFSAFMLMFGIWDIFYYIWLYVCLGWPESLLTWDILFLIPLPWMGPVLAPVLVSISLIGSALIIMIFEEKGYSFQTSLWHWLGIITGGIIIIISFVMDYKIVIDGALPEKFNWMIFGAGEIAGIIFFLHALRLTRKKGKYF